MANTKENTTGTHRDVISSTPQKEITMYDLMIYRDYMTSAQLERYGDYFLYGKPQKPFTQQEFDELKKRREYFLLRKKVENTKIELQLTKSQIQKSVDEAWKLLITSQLQQWGTGRLTA